MIIVVVVVIIIIIIKQQKHHQIGNALLLSFKGLPSAGSTNHHYKGLRLTEKIVAIKWIYEKELKKKKFFAKDIFLRYIGDIGDTNAQLFVKKMYLKVQLPLCLSVFIMKRLIKHILWT